ncbi:MAG: hypothetical protein WBV19_02550, partial [Candidatus Macondimonas sp.]
MAAGAPASDLKHGPSVTKAQLATEGPLARLILIGAMLGFLGLFLVLPLVAVFTEALARGFGV